MQVFRIYYLIMESLLRTYTIYLSSDHKYRWDPSAVASLDYSLS